MIVTYATVQESSRGLEEEEEEANESYKRNQLEVNAREAERVVHRSSWTEFMQQQQQEKIGQAIRCTTYYEDKTLSTNTYT